MISRRNYISISIIMGVVLFLCMFINNLKDAWNDYTVNDCVEDASAYPSRAGIFLPAEHAGEDAEAEAAEALTGAAAVTRNRVVCIGGPDGELARLVREWAMYTRRDMDSYPSAEAYREGENNTNPAELLVVDPEQIRWEGEDTGILKACVDQGTHLVFQSLPDPSVIRENEAAGELLGIRSVEQEETTVEGIHLYEGFLLGGEKIYREEAGAETGYQDMELTFPWYRLDSATRVYMRGLPEDEAAKPEDYPPIIWRKSFGSAFSFVINGSYMEGPAGLGLLSAISAELYPYELYPVVNAQNIVLLNYPGVADENRDVMEQYYSRSARQVFQEIVWPGVSTMLQKYPIGSTCMMTPQYDYEDDALPDGKQLLFYLKMFNEQSVETGISISGRWDTPPARKLAEDQAFFEEAAGGYDFASLYAGDMEEEEILAVLQEEALSSVRTVVGDPGREGTELFGFLSEYVTGQNAVWDGLRYSFRGDFTIRCVETAVGYLSLSCDMERVAYPQEDKDLWENLSRYMAGSVDSCKGIIEGFQGTTVSECDIRLRRFLGLDFEDSRTGDTIRLRANETGGPVWFLLRTHQEAVKSVEGGTFTKLEDGAFLIEVTAEEASIELEPAEKRYYY